jgi:hypothetical protein
MEHFLSRGLMPLASPQAHSKGYHSMIAKPCTEKIKYPNILPFFFKYFLFKNILKYYFFIFKKLFLI